MVLIGLTKRYFRGLNQRSEAVTGETGATVTIYHSMHGATMVINCRRRSLTFRRLQRADAVAYSSSSCHRFSGRRAESVHVHCSLNSA